MGARRSTAGELAVSKPPKRQGNPLLRRAILQQAIREGSVTHGGAARVMSASDHSFFYCAFCRRYTTHRWVKSIELFECEDCAAKAVLPDAAAPAAE